MPMYSQRFQRNPVAEDTAWRGVNLPSFPALSDAEVAAVCDAVHEWYGSRRGDLQLAA